MGHVTYLALSNMSASPWPEWTEHTGILGSGLSAPGTAPMFGPFMPGTCNVFHTIASARHSEPSSSLGNVIG